MSTPERAWWFALTPDERLTLVIEATRWRWGGECRLLSTHACPQEAATARLARSGAVPVVPTPPWVQEAAWPGVGLRLPVPAAVWLAGEKEEGV